MISLAIADINSVSLYMTITVLYYNIFPQSPKTWAYVLCLWSIQVFKFSSGCDRREHVLVMC